MTAKDRKRGKTTFYQEDIVEQISSPGTLGLVLRCWHDAEDIPLDHPLDPLLRPLQRGEVGVAFFLRGHRDILPESDLRLIDRAFHPGDLCKRSIDDVCAGVVTKVDVKARLEHAISGAPVEGWKTYAEIRRRDQAEVGDFVIFDDWVGQVIELYDESVVEISTGELVRLPELTCHMTVGDRGLHILQTPQGVSGIMRGDNVPSSTDTVVAVLHTVLAISWLAVNQMLDPSEAQHRKRPKRFWHGPDLSKLTLVPSRAEQLRVGDKVELRAPEGQPFTVHGHEGRQGGRIQVQTYVVAETRTTVNVLWQDGTREAIAAPSLIPYLNPDDSDCWPGDHVFWRSEGEERHAVVQSVNAVHRTASILYPDTGIRDLASLLELDPHGGRDPSAAMEVTPAGHAFGVHRGDFVFIHKDGTTNGFDKPRLPYIGELEAWVRESHVTAEGMITGWREEMSELGRSIASRRGLDNVEGQIKRLRKGDWSLSWFGEVIELRLDGTVEVAAPDSTVNVFPIERLTKLYDGLDQLDAWADDMSEAESRDYDDEMEIDEDREDDPEWEEVEDDEGSIYVNEVGWDQRSDSTMTSSGTPCEPVPPCQIDVLPAVRRPSTELPSSATSGPSSVIPPVETVVNGGFASTSNDLIPLKRFDILPAAPGDHAFYHTVPGQHSKSFLGRLTREYRVLESSLPESIIVRAYEDRTDLLRSLIIGPENTPYEDAPFVIDWLLDSNFPNTPPQAYFWSYTAGNGRVNPNLYEEGKVCLSILGTWSGDKTEVWSAARSSLLQALVSIQGLVLVKEPWFCEPAYEKLRGTEEGIVNSRLYSEKAYVLSRGFVRRALELPLGGLEEEIRRIYYIDKRLEKVLRDARALIEKSRGSHEITEADGDLAVPRLTAGGIIALDRTLSKLQCLLDAGPS